MEMWMIEMQDIRHVLWVLTTLVAIYGIVIIILLLSLHRREHWLADDAEYEEIEEEEK